MTTIAPAEAFVTVSVLIEHDGDITRHDITGQPIAPGLAITPAIGHNGFTGEWTVTHVPTGNRVCAVRGCLGCVASAALHLTGRGIDWTRDGASLTADEDVKAAAERFKHEIDESCQGANCPWPIEVAR